MASSCRVGVKAVGAGWCAPGGFDRARADADHRGGCQTRGNGLRRDDTDVCREL